MALELNFVSARTIKWHHHLRWAQWGASGVPVFEGANKPALSGTCNAHVAPSNMYVTSIFCILTSVTCMFTSVTCMFTSVTCMFVHMLTLVSIHVDMWTCMLQMLTCKNLQHAKNLQHVKIVATCKKFSTSICHHVDMGFFSNMHVQSGTCKKSHVNMGKTYVNMQHLFLMSSLGMSRTSPTPSSPVWLVFGLSTDHFRCENAWTFRFHQGKQ